MLNKPEFQLPNTSLCLSSVQSFLALKVSSASLCFQTFPSKFWGECLLPPPNTWNLSLRFSEDYPQQIFFSPCFPRLSHAVCPQVAKGLHSSSHQCTFLLCWLQPMGLISKGSAYNIHQRPAELSCNCWCKHFSAGIWWQLDTASLRLIVTLWATL